MSDTTTQKATEWDLKKLVRKLPMIWSIATICIMVLYACKERNEAVAAGQTSSQKADAEIEALARRLVETPTPTTPLLTGDVQVKAGEWLRIEVGDKVDTNTYGVQCTYKVNDDPREWVSEAHSGNINLSALNPGVRIRVIWLKPSKDLTVTITR